MTQTTYQNPETGQSWGYTETGELWCEACNGTLQVLVPGHGLMDWFDCEGPNPHHHNCENCER